MYWRTGLARESGSSPLTRGKRVLAFKEPDGQGLIPAHAGKTSTRTRSPWKQGAHPRSRGENVWGSWRVGLGFGSSPLTRGKRRHLERQAVGHGLIPAHAGKTGALDGLACEDRAHPRSRGENSSGSQRSTLVRGSSPLTRGKRRFHSHARRQRGLIPAHAGKTNRGVLALTFCPAHPRSRGENPRMKLLVREVAGSSPLTRGKPFGFLPFGGWLRLIPAHAGKTEEASS